MIQYDSNELPPEKKYNFMFCAVNGGEKCINLYAVHEYKKIELISIIASFFSNICRGVKVTEEGHPKICK